MEGCKHFWVDRTDGYEEGCAAAICLLCGEYSCYCRLKAEIRLLPVSLQKRRQKLYEELGIAGNEHAIEKENIF